MTSLSRSPQALAASSGSVICLRLVDLLVQLRIVHLGRVDVARRHDVLAVEQRVEEALRGEEVRAPPEVRADRHVGLRHLAVLRQHRRVRDLAELQLEADLLDLVLERLRRLLGRRLVVGDRQQRRARRTCRSRSRPSSCTPARAGRWPSRFDVKSKPGPSSPPASSKPAMPGGRKCVAVVPSVGPPRVCRRTVRSIDGADRTAHVDVVERLDRRVQRDVAVAAARLDRRAGPCCDASACFSTGVGGAA